MDVAVHSFCYTFFNKKLPYLFIEHRVNSIAVVKDINVTASRCK